jgi:hypothetical protein
MIPPLFSAEAYMMAKRSVRQSVTEKRAWRVGRMGGFICDRVAGMQVNIYADLHRSIHIGGGCGSGGRIASASRFPDALAGASTLFQDRI